MGYICFGAVQTPRATISARRLILGKRGRPHEIQVIISLRSGNRSVPYSGDHWVLSSSERVLGRMFSGKVSFRVGDNTARTDLMCASEQRACMAASIERGLV
jgi:hypothetical protein